MERCKSRETGDERGQPFLPYFPGPAGKSLLLRFSALISPVVCSHDNQMWGGAGTVKANKELK